MKRTSRPGRLALGSVFLAASLAWPAAAEEPPNRSIRQPGRHPVDELDLPRYTSRSNHRGWEERSRHFVVFSTASSEQARRVVSELEQTWTELGRLADTFTEVHRQPAFGISSVNVFIDSETPVPRSQPARGPNLVNYYPDIYLNVAHGSPGLDEQLPDLKAESVRSFFRVAQLDQTIPAWIQTGLSEYYSGRAPNLDAADVRALLDVPAHGSGVQPLVREASDRLQAPVRSREEITDVQSVLLVHFLLTAEDARYAPRFLLTVRQLLAIADEQNPRGASVSQGTWRPWNEIQLEETLRLDRIVEDSNVMNKVEEWLENPQSGQPIVELLRVDPGESELAADVALWLKLARRWAVPGEASPGLRVQEFRQGTMQVVETSPPAAWPLDLLTLPTRLFDPSAPPWAALDGTGRLVLWTDRDRLTGLVQSASRHQFQARDVDGQTRLICTTHKGTMLEAWFEENPEQPTRPLIRMR
jgi:hypothetical protein